MGAHWPTKFAACSFPDAQRQGAADRPNRSPQKNIGRQLGRLLLNRSSEKAFPVLGRRFGSWFSGYITSHMGEYLRPQESPQVSAGSQSRWRHERAGSALAGAPDVN